MFFSVKKQTLIYGFLVLLGITALVLCGAVKEAKDDISPAVQTASCGASGKTILIDPGHGGEDPGATANGISEKDINLSVAHKLKKCIEDNGGTAVMTREEDRSTGGDGKFSKLEDLKKRRNMAKECGADIFVSIHMNKFTQEKYKGAQVFYSASNEESRILGEAIQKALPEILNDGNTRVAKKSDGNIFILNNVLVPSVIVECGFLSNSEEAEKLKNEEYQDKMAQAIYAGIENYFNK